MSESKNVVGFHESERNASAFRERDKIVDDLSTKSVKVFMLFIFVGPILAIFLGVIFSSWIWAMFGLFIVPIIAQIPIYSKISKIEKFALEHQVFLEKIEKSVREDILNPFKRRYSTFEQMMENIEDLVNLINHKNELELVGKDVKFILIQNQVESNIEFFDDEVSKLENNDSVNLSKMLIRLLPDTNFEREVELFEKEISNLTNQKEIVKFSRMSFNEENFKREEGEYEHVLFNFIIFLDRRQIAYDLDELKSSLCSEYKSVKAIEFEGKLKRNHDKNSINIELEQLNGFEFEEFIGNLFKKTGYQVKVTKKTGDQGADLIIKQNGISTAVQTKKYYGNVGNSAVQEVVAAMKYYDCDKTMVITTGKFTKSAIELAKRNGVQLIDKEGVDALIDKSLVSGN